MSQFRFYHSIEVRYGDLDPQGHVNNAKFFTYFEQTRVQYLMALGLFTKDRSFVEVGIILAEARISYLAPLLFGTAAQAGARTTHLGNKSMHMEYTLEDIITKKTFATGSAVLVSYDYLSQQTILVPAAWRKAIIEFENLSLSS